MVLNKMVKRNKNIEKLKAGYLFPEIGRRKNEFLKKNPDAKLISLGIGNTTEPITPHIIKAMTKYCEELGTVEGYTGYDDDPKAQEFLEELKKRIANNFYNGLVDPDEVYCSDGAKPDCGRLQVLFGSEVGIAVQDPVYPVYVDGSVINGATGKYSEKIQGYENIIYMPCKSSNDFFPELDKVPRTDLIYFCSPNNPTGAVATKEQLKKLVSFANKNKSIIIFDASYSEFIQDKDLPRSIFEIKGAKTCAIEINSLSKPAGFTGIRFGWSIIPQELKFEDGSYVIDDWKRINGTLFNGASNIAQQGALAALDKTGLAEMKSVIDYYLENARLIKEGLDSIGVKSNWTGNSPYIWAEFPGKDSWEAFSDILQKAQIITTPGVGFGPNGQGYIRFSSFGHREDVKEAVKRLIENLK
jgi:LL-diaminopimelate aminotransferase